MQPAAEDWWTSLLADQVGQQGLHGLLVEGLELERRRPHALQDLTQLRRGLVVPIRADETQGLTSAQKDQQFERGRIRPLQIFKGELEPFPFVLRNDAFEVACQRFQKPGFRCVRVGRTGGDVWRNVWYEPREVFEIAP